ncbi:MAG: pyrroline-5-carboxylate reductase [Fibrobacterota bacterium]|nr:pyrroline-5-carboxylate reductase [Fibrobacterota bacterium]QQS04655.1 MAG: pyrroline-5-carboxylate reductase [Fibrobacterota bacterium]
MSIDFPVVIFGVGNMGAAIARCLRKAHPSAVIWGVDADQTKIAALEAEGVLVAAKPDWRLEDGVVVLSVKPQILDSVAKGLQERLGKASMVLSILAGVPLTRLRAAFGAQQVVRTMPNLALTVGAGATAIATDGLSEQVLVKIRSLLAPTGEVVEVLESQMDAVTGLSGSGPAYVLKFLMSLEDGGVLAGLPRPVAHRLAMATVAGTVQLAQESGAEWDVLRGQVTSPGGTTIHGLKALEDKGFTASIMNAVWAATERSKELGRS